MATSTLYQLPNYVAERRKATEHSFLLHAGRGTLSGHRLSQWLTQDHMYALLGYTRFIGILISRAPLHYGIPNFLHDTTIDLERRTLEMLNGCLSNIFREINFFEQTARTYGIDLETYPDTPPQEETRLLGLMTPVTRAYIDYMILVASTGTFEEGLVLLWAMEQLYLDAWSFAGSQERDAVDPAGTDHDSNVRLALDVLIENWTSPGFGGFVEDLSGIVDEVIGTSSKKYEAVWANVLWFEQRFWGSAIDTSE